MEEGSQPVVPCGGEKGAELDDGPDGAGFLGVGAGTLGPFDWIVLDKPFDQAASRNAFRNTACR